MLTVHWFTLIYSYSGGSASKPAGLVTLDDVRALARCLLGTTGENWFVVCYVGKIFIIIGPKLKSGVILFN